MQTATCDSVCLTMAWVHSGRGLQMRPDYPPNSGEVSRPLMSQCTVAPGECTGGLTMTWAFIRRWFEHSLRSDLDCRVCYETSPYSSSRNAARTSRHRILPERRRRESTVAQGASSGSADINRSNPRKGRKSATDVARPGSSFAPPGLDRIPPKFPRLAPWALVLSPLRGFRMACGPETRKQTADPLAITSPAPRSQRMAVTG